MTNLICDYCGRTNPEGGERCQACGALLAHLPLPETRVTYMDSPSTPEAEQAFAELQPAGDTLREGLKTAGMVAGSIGIGALILRVAAQAFAIAFSAFIIGAAAGTSAASPYEPSRLHFFTAILGGALLGVVITLLRKRSIWTLLAAPLGSGLGLLVSSFLSAPGRPLPWAAQFALAGALLFAILGGKRTRGNPIPCLKVLQPIFGALGGLLFALLGYILFSNA